jgi:hypothetical protein
MKKKCQINVYEPVNWYDQVEKQKNTRKHEMELGLYVAHFFKIENDI